MFSLETLCPTLPWKQKFTVLIIKKSYSVPEKLIYLMKYLSNDIQESVSGFLYLSSEDAFEERYGHLSSISRAFRQRLDS